MPIDSLDEDNAPPHGDAVNAAEDPEIVAAGLDRQATSDTMALPPVLHDYWEKRGFFTVRVHVVPRTCKFSPLEVPDEPPPVAIKHLDVMRSTRTDLHEFPKLTRTTIRYF